MKNMTHKNMMGLLLFLSVASEVIAVWGYFNGGLFIEITRTMSLVLGVLGLLGFAGAWLTQSEIKRFGWK